MEGHWEWIRPILEADRAILVGEFQKLEERVQKAQEREKQLREQLAFLGAEVRSVEKLEGEGWELNMAEAQRIRQDHETVSKQLRDARYARMDANEAKNYFIEAHGARCDRMGKALLHKQGWFYKEEAERNLRMRRAAARRF